jgi:formamidopyrimidine-DNA glycosylase
MPELPDLVHVARVLGREVVGRRITGARTGDPTVLRLMTAEPFPGLLVGRALRSVERRGHFLRFALDDALVLVVNAMLTGKYRLRPATGERLPRSAALALALEGGVELLYADEKRMGKVYVAPPEKEREIPQYGELGVDVLSEAFTREAFRGIVTKRRDQVRQLLMDKRALSSIGNAYADEILFAARLHPKTFCPKLAPEEVDRLFDAIGSTLRAAIAEIERRNEPIDVKVRDFLAVRGRAGSPCPACGTTIREVRVGDGDACFCPRCQPAARKLFVDFGKLPKG